MTASIVVNEGRIAASITALGKVGRRDDGSIHRVCFTPAEEEAHELVGSWLADAGLTVQRDAFGNTLGVRPGRRDDGAILIGSHIDSVPNGGNYDGAAGIVAAVEVVRAMAEAGIHTTRPVTVVCFSAEEGARFGTPCLGSLAALGMLTEEDLDRLHDRAGTTLADVLEGRGADPTAVAAGSDWVDTAATFLELHIEQGRVLEDAGQEIGVVQWVAGNRRLRMTFTGRTDHSGATPMNLRRDALVAAAEVVIDVERLARHRRGLVGTVGEFAVHPGAMTAVPGQVDLSVDVRATDVVVQERTVRSVMEGARTQAAQRRLALRLEDISDVAPVLLPSWLRRLLHGVAHKEVGTARTMISGAGHDAAVLARHMPTGMLFIPCRGGVSHSPEEYASPKHLATGSRVLCQAVLEVDRGWDSRAFADRTTGDRLETL